ncbi:MAG: glycosyltransferase family 2 protein [Flammeovirgaceae bacterium]
MNKQHIHISVVSPVYQAEALVEPLVNRLMNTLAEITPAFEIILVEDASLDDSWTKIEAQCKTHQQVKGIKLSKNFGQHQAIIAGLEQAKGEWVVVMDCDLQDPPEAITELYQKAQQLACEVVFAKRINRQDGWWKRSVSKLFFKVLSYLTEVSLDSRIANFGIYHQRVVKAILTYRKTRIVFPLMVRLVGFAQESVEIQHQKRPEGRSSYSIGKLLSLAIDILVSFTDKPLRLTMKLGIAIAGFAFLFGLFNLYKYYQGIIVVPGYASLIISIWFLAGLIIFLLGLIGLYVGKTFEQSQDRPVYITQKSLNIDEQTSEH